MAGPLPLPSTTINTLLGYGRQALLDPVIGPTVPAPGPSGNSTLQDVRIRGRAQENGVQIGTLGWVPGETGWPWAILTGSRKSVSYPETYRAWEAWTAYLHIGLGQNIDNVTDLYSWACDWEAELQQWFPAHRRFNQPLLQAGDVYWEYRDVEIRPFVDGGIAAYGPICKLAVRNVVGITWGV